MSNIKELDERLNSIEKAIDVLSKAHTEIKECLKSVKIKNEPFKIGDIVAVKHFYAGVETDTIQIIRLTDLNIKVVLSGNDNLITKITLDQYDQLNCTLFGVV